MGEFMDQDPIKARCAPVTPGWWKANRDSLLMGGGDGPWVPMDGWSTNDREFVQFAREDVPALVGEVEWLRAEATRLTGALAAEEAAHAATAAELRALGRAHAALHAEADHLEGALQVIHDYLDMSWGAIDTLYPGVLRQDGDRLRFDIAAYAADALTGRPNGHSRSAAS
jgi:hypothetical protein